MAILYIGKNTIETKDLYSDITGQYCFLFAFHLANWCISIYRQYLWQVNWILLKKKFFYFYLLYNNPILNPRASNCPNIYIVFKLHSPKPTSCTSMHHLLIYDSYFKQIINFKTIQLLQKNNYHRRTLDHTYPDKNCLFHYLRSNYGNIQ